MSRKTTKTIPKRAVKKTPRPLADDALANFCRALPGVTEDIKWGHTLCFSVGGKMFVSFEMTHGDPFDFKTDPIPFRALAQQPGFEPAPYMARFNYLRVNDRRALAQAELERWLREAYLVVRDQLPQKVRQRIPEK